VYVCIDVRPNAIKTGLKMGNIVARSKRKIEEKWRSNFRIDVVGFNRTWILDEYVGCGGLL